MYVPVLEYCCPDNFITKGDDIMGYLSSDMLNMIALAVIGIIALKQFLKTLRLLIK